MLCGYFLPNPKFAAPLGTKLFWRNCRRVSSLRSAKPCLPKHAKNTCYFSKDLESTSQKDWTRASLLYGFCATCWICRLCGCTNWPGPRRCRRPNEALWSDLRLLLCQTLTADLGPERTQEQKRKKKSQTPDMDDPNQLKTSSVIPKTLV